MQESCFGSLVKEIVVFSVRVKRLKGSKNSHAKLLHLGSLSVFIKVKL